MQSVKVNLCVIDESFMRLYSNVTRLKRIVAYVLRFIFNCRKHLRSGERRSGSLTVEELREAFTVCIITSQEESYSKELTALRNREPLPRGSSLTSLHPFLDGSGVLRVGGRLQNSNEPEEVKHQIILSGRHHLTRMIIWHQHRSLHHANFRLLWGKLRGQFWIITARSTIRNILRRCLKCKRIKAKTCEQLMGSLPAARSNPSSPFEHTGIDYAWPIKAQETPGRGKKQFDLHFCVFICFSTRAIHLEPVTDLTTEAFIATLKRFVARRGLPSHLYSDCGTNFQGAADEMEEWVILLERSNAEISDFLGNQGVQWHFNPPGAPHMGGIWESGVRSVKYHLKRTVGAAVLTQEEFQTILTMVEAALNSRPLCAISPDPDDYEALTPGHFLIGKPLTSIPEPSLLDLKENRLSRWQRVQHIMEHFWNRWRSEYIHTLQERNKWVKPAKNVEVGDLVPIKEDKLPPPKWKMARVSAVFPGDDHLVRTVEVKWKSSQIGKDGQLTKVKEHIFKRPVVKICPQLPQSDLKQV